MSKATLQTIDRKITSILTWLPAAAVKTRLPEIKKGEVYVGGTIGLDGRIMHTILLPGEKTDINWVSALAWARGLLTDGTSDLPNRIEQAMLWAHHRKHFQEPTYWSNEQCAQDSDYAWRQSFFNGNQYGWHKAGKLMARAVRRVKD